MTAENIAPGDMATSAVPKNKHKQGSYHGNQSCFKQAQAGVSASPILPSLHLLDVALHLLQHLLWLHQTSVCSLQLFLFFLPPVLLC